MTNVSQEITQLDMDSLYRNFKSLEIEILPHLASHNDIGRHIERQVDPNNHKLNTEIARSGRNAQFTIISELSSWKEDYRKLRGAIALLKRAHASEALQEEQARLVQEQVEWNA